MSTTSSRVYTFTNGAGRTSMGIHDPVKEIAENVDGTWSLWIPTYLGSWSAICLRSRTTLEDALSWLTGRLVG